MIAQNLAADDGLRHGVMSVQIAKRHFTVDEYERMSGAGILLEDDRVELIGGEIVEMSPIGHLHASCVKRLIALFTCRVPAGTFIVSAQDPVRLDDYSEPQPDIALLRPRADFYANAHPAPADVLLLIEVADTSFDYDRFVKLPLYASAGVGEVWIVNLARGAVELFSRPADGEYQSSRTITGGESFAPAELPQLELTLKDVLG
jgi:Uma2 family endonuclease